MKPKDRSRARALCAEYSQRGDPLGWFEALYQQARADESIIPWADMVPNPHLCEWQRRTGYSFRGKHCLKIGCGLGDDSEHLASLGASVVAFDISPTAIAWCRQRFPASRVTYVVADLFAALPGWQRSFDFVLESYTLQALPPHLRPVAIEYIANSVAPSGALLVICRGREMTEPAGTMPWPLTRQELQPFSVAGLSEISFEDYMDTEMPPVRRFRVCYTRPARSCRS
jgi:SAM-dependent methyltransferase